MSYPRLIDPSSTPEKDIVEDTFNLLTRFSEKHTVSIDQEILGLHKEIELESILKKQEKALLHACLFSYMANPNYLYGKSKSLADLNDLQRYTLEYLQEIQNYGPHYTIDFFHKHRVNLLMRTSVEHLGAICPEIVINYISLHARNFKPDDIQWINNIFYHYHPDYKNVLNALHSFCNEQQTCINAQEGLFTRIHHHDIRFFCDILDFLSEKFLWSKMTDISSVIGRRLAAMINQLKDYLEDVPRLANSRTIEDELAQIQMFIDKVSRHAYLMNKKDFIAYINDPLKEANECLTAVRKIRSLIPVCQDVNDPNKQWRTFTHHLFHSAPQGVLDLRKILQPIDERLFSGKRLYGMTAQECNQLFDKTLEKVRELQRPYQGCGKREGCVDEFYHTLQGRLGLKVEVDEKKEAACRI